MATRDTGQRSSGLTRRDFLKTAAAATAVAGCGFEMAYDPQKAEAYEGNSSYTVTSTTCPYCSASCGQRVVKDNATGKVVDIYGDFESIMNSGGLCAKGAGSLQLVNNPRRVGAWATHYNPVFAATTDTTTYPDGVAYRRDGDGPWSKVLLGDAMTEIATTLKTKRDGDPAWTTSTYNGKGVAFFGCSHMNNESNYIYRKLIANFGSSNVEHQARI